MMNTGFKNWTLPVVFVLLVLGIVSIRVSANSYDRSFQSPLEFDIPTPTPTPISPFQIPEEQSPLTRAALEYIVSKTNIPLEQLIVTSEEPIYFLYLDNVFWRVGFFYSQEEVGWDILVDPEEGTIFELAEVEAADREKKYEKYGKLEPHLHEILQTLDPEDVIDVMIWVAGETSRTEQERFLLLAEKYPQAKAAMSESGSPFDVDDGELFFELQREYSQMLIEDYLELVEPLVEHFQVQGYQVTILNAAPVIGLTLTKQEIFDIELRPEVGAIFYPGPTEQQVESSIAIPSDRVPIVWDRGFNGSGVGIAILEANRIDNSSGYLNIAGSRAICNYLPLGDHKTEVAHMAGSNRSNLQGVAPGVNIYDACYNWTIDWEDIPFAIIWASNYAKILILQRKVS
jgi:hypothetical protein